MNWYLLWQLYGVDAAIIFTVNLVQFVWTHQTNWKRWLVLLFMAPFTPIVQIAEWAQQFGIHYLLEPEAEV